MAGEPAAGWYQDPTHRFDQRYWNGSDWTEYVVIDGLRATDAVSSTSDQSTDDFALDRLVADVAGHHACDLGPIDATRVPDSLWLGRRIAASDVVAQIHAATKGGFRFELSGARIVGTLLLRDTTWAVPIKLTSCWIDGGIEADFATISDLDLSNTRIGMTTSGWGVSGRFVGVSGDLCLSGAWVTGGCQLVGATIKGSLDASDAALGAHARTPNGGTWSLDLTNGILSGDLSLRGSATTGGVCIAGATVTGQVVLEGAHISASGGSPVAGRDAHMSECAAVWGQECTIGESLLANPIKHDDQTTQPSTFAGYVSLVSSKVEGSVNFRAAHFDWAPGEHSGDAAAAKPTADTFGQNRTDIALDLYRAKVGTFLLLSKAVSPETSQVDLRHCTVERLESGDSLWHAGYFGIKGLTYQSVDGTARSRRRWIGQAFDGNLATSYLTLAAAAHSSGASHDELKAKIVASSKASHGLERWIYGAVRFGYRPYLVVVPLILLGLLTFYQVGQTRDDPHGFAPVVVDNKSYTPATCVDAKVRCLNPAAFALDAVIPVDQHQVSTWRPDRSTTDGERLAWLITIDQLMSWFFAGVLVASVGGFLKRT